MFNGKIPTIDIRDCENTFANTTPPQSVEQILFQIGELQREINEHAKKRDTSIEFYNSRIEDAKKIFDTDTAAARDEISSLTVQLQRFFNEHPPARKKSYNFAGGTFGYRQQATRFVYDAEVVSTKTTKLLDVLGDDFAKVERSLDWQKLKSDLRFDDNGDCYLQSTGELVNGLKARPQPDAFFVKPRV